MHNVWAAVLIAATGFSFNVSAQDRPTPPGEKLWKTSLVTLAGANLLDSVSSWGKCEANPLLAGSGGHFDSKALLLKGAALGGVVVLEQLTGKSHPRFYRFFTGANFAFSVGLTTVAVRNFSQPSPSPGYACH